MEQTGAYPIVLVHGMGVRDGKRLEYWGRIPKVLRAAGRQVFSGGQDANGSVEDNAAVLKARILSVLAETGSEKVNVIAHSKGGLDTRYMISHLDMGGRVASLTTLATPHHGSRTVDWLLKLPDWLVRFACRLMDFWMRLLGDRNPKTCSAVRLFTTPQAAAFNAATPDDPRVYYQSYAFIMKHWHSDLLLALPHAVVGRIEGPNDGLLPPEAVRWANFRGVFTGNGRRGISHFDEMDLRRRPLTKKTGPQVTDVVEVYRAIEEDLTKLGF